MGAGADAPVVTEAKKPKGRTPKAPKPPIVETTGETAGINPPPEPEPAPVPAALDGNDVRVGTITTIFELYELVANQVPVGCSVTIVGKATPRAA